jgi:complex III assembly factor LYRM7
MVQAVRQTFTSPTLTPPKPTTPRAPEPTSCSSATDPAPEPPVEEVPVETEVSEEELEKRIGEWKEIALFLRRNVVQGEQGDDGSFRMSSLSCFRRSFILETNDRSESYERY